jgi:Flp pilus assembly protein TadD
MMATLRAVLGHILLTSMGGWALYAQFEYRVPNRYASIVMPLVCLVLSVLGVVLLAAHVVRRAPADDPWRRAADRLQQVTSLFLLAFTFYGLFLFLNGRLDASGPTSHPARILTLAGDEVDLGVRSPFVWADVQSWRTPGAVERLLLTRSERDRAWGGQPVVVTERRGYFGVAWVSRLEADEEQRARLVLQLSPTATQLWSDLAMFYVRHRRWDDARVAGSRYLALRPDELYLPVELAEILVNNERFAEAVALLEPLASRPKSVELQMLYGASLTRVDRIEEGIVALEAAIALEPGHWWPHYVVGIAYSKVGDYRRAVTAFEASLRGRPGNPEVEYYLSLARQLAPNQPPGGRIVIPTARTSP